MTWECPRRLAAAILNFILGKLGSILNRLGRLDRANLIVHPRVEEYLRLVREEKSRSSRFSVTSGSTYLRYVSEITCSFTGKANQ